MAKTHFEWDENKNSENLRKHSVPFELAQSAFADPKRVIAEDLEHSQTEKRFYCFGKVGAEVLTVRLIGAGYWRRGKKIYEEQS